MALDNVVPTTYLLLLPPPPVCVSYDSMRSKYELSISATLKQLTAELKSTVGCTLDLALPLPFLTQDSPVPKSDYYPAVQDLLSLLYKVICVVAVRDKINVENAEGIDIRVLLVAHTSGVSSTKGPAKNLLAGNRIGATPSLAVLAASARPWQYVFAVDNSEGDEILRTFLLCQDRHLKVQKVAGNTGEHPAETTGKRPNPEQSDHPHHSSVALGGTFDHIHIGHKLLLTMSAFLLSAQDETQQSQQVLTIGITGDELLRNKKHAELLESWDDRQRSTSNFVRAITDFRPPSEAEVSISTQHEPGPNGHAVHVRMSIQSVIRCVEIADPFGPTITDAGISALVVSAETRAGGKAVNDKRVEKGWTALEVFEVDVLDADESDSNRSGADEGFENKLSSTRIRQALSDRAKIRSKA